jgi:phospholipid/cholesterol/gamma-HCH transport system substrate-binding protein
MKFRIRNADKIVGLFIIIALGIVVFAIFMLGSKHRWFAKDQIYKTYFDSASGLSTNMPVQYKGFTIGNVKTFDLNAEDLVEVRFTIYDTYLDRVREGSLVELRSSPIGIGGSQLIFYPGVAEAPMEGDIIYNVNSDEGKLLIENGLAFVPNQDDSITTIVNRVTTLLGNINGMVTQLRNAFRGLDTAGRPDDTALGRTVAGVEGAVKDASSLLRNVDGSLEPIMGDVDELIVGINEILLQAQSLLGDLKVVTAELANPDSLVLTVLDTDGAIYTNIEKSLSALSGTLGSLESTAAYLPAQVMPQVMGLITQVRETLVTVDDVLIGLRNNPLLKNGIPEKVQSGTGGTSPRDVAF